MPSQLIGGGRATGDPGGGGRSERAVGPVYWLLLYRTKFVSVLVIVTICIIILLFGDVAMNVK